MARNKHPEVTINRILDTSWELFMEKGYEATTIQDIVNALGDLSKGAIYHHFKSKEEILDAVTDRFYKEQGLLDVLTQNPKNKTGLERLQQCMIISLESPFNHAVYHMVPDLLKNARMLVMQVKTSMEDTAPSIQVLIEQGVADGSIHTKYPKELAETLILLSNLWITPALFTKTREEFYEKIKFLDALLSSQGLNLINEAVKKAIDVFADAVYSEKINLNITAYPVPG